MNEIQHNRDNGANGALLDEYEKSIKELKIIIESVTPNELVQIVDPNTKDEDYRSIQTILTHVVRAGYNYIIEIRRSFGEDVAHKDIALLDSIDEYSIALDKMFLFNENLFTDYPDIVLEEYECQKKIQVKWGQRYDVEQLFEHAIVHILRHRRQIERFIQILRIDLNV